MTVEYYHALWNNKIETWTYTTGENRIEQLASKADNFYEVFTVYTVITENGHITQDDYKQSNVGEYFRLAYDIRWWDNKDGLYTGNYIACLSEESLVKLAEEHMYDVEGYGKKELCDLLLSVAK
jgi:hypothetical protein